MKLLILGYLLVCIDLMYCVKPNTGSRRIIGGTEAEGNKTYMVYFLRANINKEPITRQEWSCGGALITKLHILTSATCLSTFQYLYAIAGYKRYVKAEYIDFDLCTRKRKKKVVKTCIPKPYRLPYSKVQAWAMENNIGLAIVDSPYNFTDTSYIEDCSYMPRPIPVNFGLYAQREGADVVELGWGYTRSIKQSHYFKGANRNKEYLHEASTQIVNNDICKEKYNGTSYSNENINFRKLICTSGMGNIDSEGNVLDFGELLESCESTTINEYSTTVTADKKTTIDYTQKMTKTTRNQRRQRQKKKTKNYEFTETIQSPRYEKYSQYDMAYYEYDDKREKLTKTVDSTAWQQYQEARTNDSDHHKSSKPPDYGPYDMTYDMAYDNEHDFRKNLPLEDMNFDKYYRAADKFDFTQNSTKDFVRQIMGDIMKKYRRDSGKPTSKNICRRIMRGIIRRQNLRRWGPSTCQNDIGGPLVSWVGDTEIVLGVAVTNLHDDVYNCMPPNLFTSTAYHPWFISCIIESHINPTDINEDIQRHCSIENKQTEQYDVLEQVHDWSKDLT